MKIKTVRFVKSAPKAQGFPEYTYPEFAFFGRSNTGKSSLINMITGRKSLVKTGASPGVTRLVNFFLINENISIADLPGFGYAKLAKSERGKFLPLIKEYVRSRMNLKIAFLLIDIRRIPGKFEKDLIIDLTARNIPVAVLGTKCDKLSKNQKLISAKKISRELEVEPDSVFFTSSKTGEGKDDIIRLMDEFSG